MSNKEHPRTYDELLGAIERDITPRIVETMPTIGLTEAIHQALHYPCQPRDLIAEFVGWKHAQLKEKERNDEQVKKEDALFYKNQKEEQEQKR